MSTVAVLVAGACALPPPSDVRAGPRAGVWTALDPPAARPGRPVLGAVMSDVSCPTSTWCLAVGTYQDDQDGRALVQSWDGGGWRWLPDIPLAEGRFIAGDPVAACGARDDCVVAVPTDSCPLAMFMFCTGSRREPVLAAWDGVRWAVAPAGAPLPPALDAVVEDVACGGPRSCLVIGHGAPQPAGAEPTFAEAWDGETWTAVPAPPFIGGGRDGRLSCATPTFCARIKGSLPLALALPLRQRTSVEIWDGVGWAATPAPVPSATDPGTGQPYEGALLRDIDCPVAGTCLAAGGTVTTGLVRSPARGPVVTTWDGSSWTSRRLTGGTQLDAISCATGERCLALDNDGDGGAHPAVRALDGPRPGWTVTDSPDQPPTRLARARAVSCAGDACLVVGSTGNDERNEPMAYHYRFAT